jgi:hypothetical protein
MGFAGEKLVGRIKINGPDPAWKLAEQVEYRRPVLKGASDFAKALWYR